MHECSISITNVDKLIILCKSLKTEVKMIKIYTPFIITYYNELWTKNNEVTISDQIIMFCIFDTSDNFVSLLEHTSKGQRIFSYHYFFGQSWLLLMPCGLSIPGLSQIPSSLLKHTYWLMCLNKFCFFPSFLDGYQ